MTETSEQSTVRRRVPRQVVGVVALAAISISGWFIWQQIADAWKLPGRTIDSAYPGRSQQAVRPAAADPPYDITKASVSIERIFNGGPGKDGIPSLTDAKFVPASEASFIAPEDQVIGVTVGEEAKAYPLKILDSHEAVNDRLGDEWFTVTYCPLCDSSAVFDRVYDEQEYEFGISGMLYNSNVLLYDRASDGQESLWSQMASSAVVGAKNGQELRRLPLEVTTWDDWSTRHPHTLVLSTDTGYQRPYQNRVYRRYFAGKRIMFPVEPMDDRMEAKTPVLGVISPNSTRAYPLSSFAKADVERVEDELDGLKLTLTYDPQHESLRVAQAEEGLEWMYSFWFAWAAFYPETDIYRNSLNSKADKQ